MSRDWIRLVDAADLDALVMALGVYTYAGTAIVENRKHVESLYGDLRRAHRPVPALGAILRASGGRTGTGGFREEER